MGAENALQEGVRARAPRRRRRAVLALAAALLASGCYTQRPKSDSAPSSAPAAREPAPPPPEQKTTAPREEESAQPVPSVGAAPTAAGAEAAPGKSPPPARVQRPAPKDASKRKAGALAESADEPARGSGALERPRTDTSELRSQLDRAYRAASPDCPTARDRKKAVCDLASQICQLTDRDPNVASVAEYCDEAKRRCNDAERRTVERCPE